MAKKSINVEIGARIRESRELAGLTQEQLAKDIGRSTQFVSTIERGSAGPSLSTIIKLCEVLEVSTEWLLRGLQPPRSEESAVMKLSGLSAAQSAIVDRMAGNLVKLITVTREEQADQG